MTTIEAASTLAEVIAAHNDFAATSEQMTNWVELTALAAGEASTFVGLFSAELTDFIADCATSDDCDEADYDAYSGWAIGVSWTVASATVDD